MDNGKPREGQLCRLVIDGYASDGAGVARLESLTELDTEIGFDVHVYERTGE